MQLFSGNSLCTAEENAAKVREFYMTYPYPGDKLLDYDKLNKHAWILSALPFPIKNGSSIVDVGCGTGEMACFLSRFGNVTGIDFSENSIKISHELKTNLGIRNVYFYEDDITLRKERGVYDYLFCIGVLLHIPRVEDAFSNIKQMMHKDSLLIIGLGNKYAPYPRKIKEIAKDFSVNRKMDLFNHPYVTLFSMKEAKSFLRKNGFEIVNYWRKMPDIMRWILKKNSIMLFCVRKIK